MNTQQIFDTVVTHLLTQNARSFGEAWTCAYRGEGGRMCAVGCLIKDEHYRPDLEGISVDSVSVMVAVEASLGRTLDQQEAYLLRGLQATHDSVPTQEWPAALGRIAKTESLTIPTILQERLNEQV